MKLTMIAAMDRNRVIGRDGGMPWHLPADLRHFKRKTWGHPILVGRRTWESLPGILPGRSWVVLSSRLASSAAGEETEVEKAEVGTKSPEQGEPGEIGNTSSGDVAFYSDFDAAMAYAELVANSTQPPRQQVFVAGGAALYSAALPFADRMELTHIEADLEGDTYFPAFELKEWQVVAEERRPADSTNMFALVFRSYERLGGAPSR